MLFSFVMYKSSPSNINKYIEENSSSEKEYFTFDEVCELIQAKNKIAKEKEADEIFNYLAGNKQYLTKNRIIEEFKDKKIGMTEDEIKEMFNYIMHKDYQNDNNSNVTTPSNTITRDDFRNFYTFFK